MTVTPPPRAAAAPASTADASPALPDRCTTVIGTGPDFAISSATNPVPSGEASSTMITSTANPRPTSASPQTSRGRESRSLYVGTTTERTGSGIRDPRSDVGAGPVVSPEPLGPWGPAALLLITGRHGGPTPILQRPARRPAARPLGRGATGRCHRV